MDATDQFSPEAIAERRKKQLTFTEWQVSDKTFYGTLAVLACVVFAAAAPDQANWVAVSRASFDSWCI